MPKEIHLIYSAVYGILRKDNKVFLMRRFNTGYRDGFLTLPAGHIEKDELPRETMLRELKEEIGIICNPESIIGAHAMHRVSDGGRTYVDYYFEISKYEGEPENKEPEKCDLVGWYDEENLPENTLLHVKTALNFIKNKIPISEMRKMD
jgi:8-oxo-dGTP pyrophosphatase MutT (NUDIX family)